MKEKIKKEKYNLIILAIFIMCALFSLPNYLKVHQKDEANYTKHYEECLQNPNENICKYYKEPYLKRDTFNTMGYILLVEDYTSILQMLSPLLIMCAAIPTFNKKLRKGYLKNSITREGYKKSMFKTYFKTYKSTLIIPIFILILFFISYLISGNFEYEKASIFHGYDFSGIENGTHIIRFFIFHFLIFILHAIFWINIAIYNVKYNKSTIISIVVSFIEYTLFAALMQLIGKYFMKNAAYFNLYGIFTWYYKEMPMMLIMAVLLAFISIIVVYFEYKNKEKILEVI